MDGAAGDLRSGEHIPTLPHLLQRAARSHPEHVALASPGRDLTYRDWDERAGAVAAGLRERGVASGDVVALRLPDWDDFAVCSLGVMRAGCVAAPLDPLLGETEAARAVAASGAAAVVSVAAVGDVRYLDPGELERPDGDRSIAAEPDAVALALHRDGRLTRPAPLTSTHRELTARPRAEPGALVHAFPVGSRYSVEPLGMALVSAPLRCLALDAADPARIAARVAAENANVLLLHGAVAAAVAVTPAPGDLAGVTAVILVGSAPDPVVRRLAQMLPAAGVSVLPPPAAAAGQGREGASTAPAAPSQEGMLWHEVFTPGCQNLPGLARRYRGPLDVTALEGALDEIVRRHAPLRTTFEVHGGRLLQVIHPHRGLRLPLRDLTALPPGERERRVDAVVAEAGRRPFDLVAGPLFDAELFRLAPEDHVLVIRTHHAVFDDWSVGVFRREVAALYAALTAGEAPSLPRLETSFPTFAENVARRLSGPDGERDLAFWRGELAGAPLVTQLDARDPSMPPGTPQPSAGPVPLELPADLARRLRDVARDARATTFMAMLAGFGALVAVETERDDVLLATVVANRDRTPLEPLVGCFTKKIPLRLRLHGDPPFAEVIARARRSLLAALSHGSPAFETVIQDALGADAAAHGLVPHVAIVFQGVTPRHELVLPAVETTGFETAARATRTHFAGRAAPTTKPWGGGLYSGTFMIVSVEDDDGHIKIAVRGAFHRAAVEELLARYRDLLARVVADPGTTISRLSDKAGGGVPGIDLRGARLDLDGLGRALGSCRGAGNVKPEVVSDDRGVPVLSAEFAGADETLDRVRLRVHLWRELPGYAWPARMRARGGRDLPGGETWIEVALREVWRSRPHGNYWQDFSFVEALEEARAAGLRIPAAAVTRNRTVETLAIALTAEARGR